MAQFPNSENQIYVLGVAMYRGLSNSPVFRRPPIDWFDLLVIVKQYEAKRNTAVSAIAKLEAAAHAKAAALQRLADAMKKDLRYAELAVNYDNEKLKLIGWGAKNQPSVLMPPGQPRHFEIGHVDEYQIKLTWKPPVDGGKVAAYKVQRRSCPDGPWLDVATAIETTATITAKERSKEYEWQVIAVNKAGDGMPSNIVMTVL